MVPSTGSTTRSKEEYRKDLNKPSLPRDNPMALGILTDPVHAPAWKRELGSQNRVSLCELANEVANRNAATTSGSTSQRLPSIEHFGIMDIRKPADHEIRLGNVSKDCLSRINEYSSMLSGPSNSPDKIGMTGAQPHFGATPPTASMMGQYIPVHSVPNTISVAPYDFRGGYSSGSFSQPGFAQSERAMRLSASAPYHPPYSQHTHQHQEPTRPPSGNASQASSSSQAFHCQYQGCTKNFPSRSRLARHEIVHQGQKNFGCIHPGCPKKFSRKDNMLQHYRNHLNNAKK